MQQQQPNLTPCRLLPLKYNRRFILNRADLIKDESC